MTTLTTPCANTSHSPRLTSGKGWSCPECTLAAVPELEPTADEWTTFTRALRSVVRADRTVHQCDVRPLIRGRIEPKHIGNFWRRARAEALVVEVGHERSNDTEGRNAGRMEPYYEWRAAA